MSAPLILDIDELLDIKQVELQDAEVLFHVIDSQRNYLRKFLNWIDATQKVEDSQQYIQSCIQQTSRLQAIHFVIRHQQKIIGGISLYDWRQDTKIIHLGYWISENFSNQGIVSKCCKRLIDYAFFEIGIEKMQLYFIPENVASERVADKLGFKIEGFIRQSFMLNGSIKDQYLAGLLKEEYKP